MKVLVISTHFNIGGISNYILTLASQLKSIGVDTVVASSGGNLVEELRKNGVAHLKIPSDTKFEFDPRLLIAALQLKNFVKAEGVDIIHAHTRVSQVIAFLVSRMTGIPVVTTCHGYFKVRARKIFDTWGEKVIAISAAVKEHLMRDLGVSEERISLIYSGVDVERFSRDPSKEEALAIKAEMGLKPSPVIGTVGRLSQIKGQIYMVEALGRVIAKRPDVQGLIIGDGPERETLRKRAALLGIAGSIKFINSNVDTPRFLSIMDIFVFPSIKEGLGIALLEALAAGRACVASDVGGIGDIITDGVNGKLVKAEDPAAIAGAVLKLLDDTTGQRDMGERGRRIVRERFTLDRMAGDVAKLYRDVIRR